MVHDNTKLIKNVATGVYGLDTVLAGGLPEFSFTVIAGGPGAGKTTLAQQIAFATGATERPALFFTVLGEPAMKMIRYQSQFDFFDAAKVGKSIHFVNLTDEVTKLDFDAVLARIIGEVEKVRPRVVIVDSFRTLALPIAGVSTTAFLDLARFVQRLAQFLATWESTSFLLGEYADDEFSGPLFTVADNVIRLSQVTDRNSVVRKLQVLKSRGRAAMPGLHTFRITTSGLRVFPRIPDRHLKRRRMGAPRQGSGVPGMDALIGGGIPRGDALMIAGPAGSGKTTFARQFVLEGLRAGEGVAIAAFDEYPEEYFSRAKALDAIEESTASGRLQLIYLRPLDLSVDETLSAILSAVSRSNATRVVIDSLSGFETALAPSFREEFKESLYRMVGALTAIGVTVLMTCETDRSSFESNVTTQKLSFISDDIVIQRFVEIRGRLQRVLSITKMRASPHSTDFHEYFINEDGAFVGNSLKGYQGISTGVPELVLRSTQTVYPGLTDRETDLLDAIVRHGPSTVDFAGNAIGAPLDEAGDLIGRLMALGYVSRDDESSGLESYRAVAQERG